MDSLFEDIDYSCSPLQAWFGEINVDYVRNLMSPVGKCLRDGGIVMRNDMRNMNEVIWVGGSTHIPKLQSGSFGRDRDQSKEV